MEVESFSVVPSLFWVAVCLTANLGKRESSRKIGFYHTFECLQCIPGLCILVPFWLFVIIVILLLDKHGMKRGVGRKGDLFHSKILRCRPVRKLIHYGSQVSAEIHRWFFRSFCFNPWCRNGKKSIEISEIYQNERIKKK